ncbi:50S ribosomal protein L18 [Candidatus Microgenomates bacterium]|nr:50S ribosomal protein L18 [Candidatus Microgenomates bacterium]
MNKRPRFSVFRSNKHIYGQIIDDEKNITLVAASDTDLLTNKKRESQKTQKKTEGTENSVPSKKFSVLSDLKKYSKTEKARLVGELLAQRALKIGIKQVKFDRRNYKYHGRVKTLAEGARKGGLKF